MVSLPVFGILNVYTDADAYHWKQGLYEDHYMKVCTDSQLWEKNPLHTRELNLSQYDASLFGPML